MTAIGDARQDENEDENEGDNEPEERRRARVAWDVGWSVEHGIDELRLAYARLVLNLNRLRAVTAGSRHVLPARARRHWNSALTLANHAERSLTGAVAELRKLPGVGPFGSVADLTAALGEATDGVRASVTDLIDLRHQIDTAIAGESGGALPAAALSQLRQGAGALDELTARMQQGCAALAAYADGVAGMDPRPGRTARAVVLAQAAWHPPDGVDLGAKLASRLVAEAARRPQEPPVPAHLRVPWYRRAVWRSCPSWHGFRISGGSRRSGTGTDAAFFDDFLRALLLLAQGNTIGYAHRLDLFRHAGRLGGYADALAAAVVAAVDRRLTWGRDGETVRRLAARLHARYDGGTREVPAETAENLIRAALGAAPPPVADPVRLTLLQTLLLVDLLADERLDRADRVAFRAEATEVAVTIGPARLADAEPTDRELADRERICDGCAFRLVRLAAGARGTVVLAAACLRRRARRVVPATRRGPRRGETAPGDTAPEPKAATHSGSARTAGTRRWC